MLADDAGREIEAVALALEAFDGLDDAASARFPPPCSTG